MGLRSSIGYDRLFDNSCKTARSVLLDSTMLPADFHALGLLMTLASERSFRGTARVHGISPSAVSHAISGLERRLGTRLVARTTRSVALTESGQALVRRVGPSLSETESALHEAAESRGEPAGRLRITVPRSAAVQLVLPKLADFAATYPKIHLELHVDDGLKDIIADGFDGGIRLEHRIDRDMVAVRLDGGQRAAVVGSRDYLARAGRPQHPKELAHHICIDRIFPDGSPLRWPFEKNGVRLTVSVAGNVSLDDTGLILEAAKAGTGLAYLFESEVALSVADKSLEQVLADWCPRFDGFRLYYPRQRYLRPALRVLIQHLRVAPIETSTG